MNVADYFNLLTIVSHRIISFYCSADIAMFECACCNKILAHKWFDMLSRSTISDLKYTKHTSSWILKRKLHPVKVLIDAFMSEDDIVRFTEISSTITDLRFKFARLSTDTFQYLLKHCPNVSAFHTSSYSNLSQADLIPFAPIATAFSKLKELEIHSPKLSRAAFQSILKLCTKLSILDISSCSMFIRDGGLQDIAELCTNLTSLTADHLAYIEDRHLRSVAVRCTNLCRITLKSNHLIWSRGLHEFVRVCAPLEYLYFENVLLSLDTCNSLALRNPHLRELHLPCCDGFNDCALMQLATQCTQLRVLNLVHSVQLTGKSMSLGQRCSSLRWLSIDDSPRFNDVVCTLISSCTCLERLELYGRERLASYESVLNALVAASTGLTTLHLERPTLCDNDVIELVAHCTKLTKLIIKDSFLALKDSALLAICQLTHLRHLQVSGYHVVVSGAALQRVVTHCRALRCLQVPATCEDVALVDAIDACV